jgi:hypothetical protein
MQPEKKSLVAQLVKKFLVFIDPEGSLSFYKSPPSVLPMAQQPTSGLGILLLEVP